MPRTVYAKFEVDHIVCPNCGRAYLITSEHQPNTICPECSNGYERHHGNPCKTRYMPRRGTIPFDSIKSVRNVVATREDTLGAEVYHIDDDCKQWLTHVIYKLDSGKTEVSKV